MSTTTKTLTTAVPMLPVPDVPAALAAMRDQFGFAVTFETDGYAGVRRDTVELHLFQCEQRLVAEWTSCRIHTAGIDALYAELMAHGVIHPNGAIAEKPWGAREFTALLPGGAALVFAEWRA